MKAETDRALLAVWVASVVSIAALGAAAATALGRPGPPRTGSGADLWLEVEAAGTAWAALVLWKTRRIDALRNGAIDPATGAGRSALRRISIVCWALVESIAVFGFVLVFLRRTPLPGIVFLGAALLIVLLLFPRVSPPTPAP